jgi:hypothetical protein
MNSKINKGQKVKVDDEEYIVEDVNEDGYFNEENGSGSKSREVVLSKAGEKSNKIVKHNYKVNVDKDNNSISMAKVTETSEKFKNGFSYEKSSVFMSRSTDNQDAEDEPFRKRFPKDNHEDEEDEIWEDEDDD